MRNVLLIIGGLVLTVLVSMGLYAYPQVRDVALQGTGYVAKNVCSGHFVSGFPVDQFIEEALLPIDDSLADMNVMVDEDAQTVDVNVYGIFSRRAVHMPGFGCSLLAPGDTEPRFAVSPIQYFAPPSNEPWPRGDGPINRSIVGVDYPALGAAIDAAFSDPDPEAPRYTKAVAVIWRGQLIAERYADGVNQHTPLISWSMAKSVTNAQLGILFGQEELELFGPVPVPEWQGEEDPRREITLDQMLRMSSGLQFDETYAVGTDVTRMLSQEVSAGGFAASMPLAYEPGEHWAYSSGTSNILARLIRDTVGGTSQNHYLFAQENLFQPLRANSFVLEMDPSGSVIGSSYNYATARDWARLGQLYLQDGIWEGNRILPPEWVNYSRTPTVSNPQHNYGAHFWLNRDPEEGYEHVEGLPAPMWPDAPRDAYSMNGFQGQHVVIIPSRDLVIVRLGFTINYLETGMNELIAGVVDAVEGENGQ